MGQQKSNVPGRQADNSGKKPGQVNPVEENKSDTPEIKPKRADRPAMEQEDEDSSQFDL